MAFKCVCGNHKIIIDNETGTCDSCGSVFSNDDNGNILISKHNGSHLEEPRMYIRLGEDNKIVCS